MIVDNSGNQLAETNWPGSTPRAGVTVVHPDRNIGFGAAVNLGSRVRPAEFIAALNDDAVAEPGWLENMVDALDRHPEAGSAAPQVRLHGFADALDSAGMLIAADGSSKQRGHGSPPGLFARPEEALLPSGSAALYRSSMLTETGGFEDSFFLYCEDTDLGLRARWAGWTCRYVPEAVVRHRYSHSAGRASRLKVFYVERNRLLLLVRNFPLPRLLLAIPAAPVRYLYHLAAIALGRGAASRYTAGGGTGWSLVVSVLRAHLSAAARLPRALRQRRRIRRSARISSSEFNAVLSRYSISLRQVAEQ